MVARGEARQKESSGVLDSAHRVLLHHRGMVAVRVGVRGKAPAGAHTAAAAEPHPLTMHAPSVICRTHSL